MANPITNFIRDHYIKPEVDRETSALKKQLNSAQEKLEVKDFDLITQISGKFGVNARRVNHDLLSSYVSWTYANINAIAERVADIHFELYKFSSGRNEDNVEKLDQHEALDLLLRVNDYQTKWDLIYTFVSHMLSMGEAAWYLVGRTTPSSLPTEIWALRPDYLKIIPGDLENNEFIKRYEYKIPGKDTVIFEPWEILFFRSPHPTNAYRGYGVIEAAATDIDIDLYANRYNKNFFGNFARPDGVLMTEQALSPEVAERVENRWGSKYGGTENAGKTAILEKGLKYEAIQPTAKDMDFLEQQRWTRDKLMAMFRNTKTILGITEDVNRANAEASELVWIKHNIKPKMQRLVDNLNEFLIPIYGDNLFLSFEDPLPESTELKFAEYEKGHNRWLTTNEIREREGLDPVEGGDVLYIPFTIQPMLASTAEEPEESEVDPVAPVVPPEDEEGKTMIALKVMKGEGKQLTKRFAREIQVLKNRNFRSKNIERSVNKVIKSALAAYSQQGKAKILALDDGEVHKDIQQKRWETFVNVAEVFEKQAEKIVSGVISRHEKATIKLIRNTYKPGKGWVSKSATDLVPPDKEFVKVSLDALTPILLALAKEQGDDVLEFLGADGSFNIREAFINAVKSRTLEASESYVGTVKERIVKALAAGIAEGEGIGKLTNRIRTEYGVITPREAKRVARTESIRSANAATEEGFKQSGVVRAKQWFTALDERVDDECAALDGKIVDVEDEFMELDHGPEVYRNVGFPPLHPNCRCTISPVILSKSTTVPKKKQVKAVPRVEVKREAPKAVAPTVDVEAMKTQIKTELREDVKNEVREELNAELETRMSPIIDKIIKAVKNES